MSRHLWIFCVVALLSAGCGSEDERESTTTPQANAKKEQELPFGFGSPFPEPVFEIPEEERAARVKQTGDFCEIDGEGYFVRGQIEIPVHGEDELFRWDVWVSLSKENYQRSVGLMNRQGREEEAPYYGWLSTELEVYGPTLGLKVLVHTQPVGLVPRIELQRSEHPLCVEQRDGITLERVKEIVAYVMGE